MASAAIPAIFSCQLNWEISTVELFNHIASRPWAMLLDSAGANHPDSRYDIIVCDPIATIETQDDITYIRDKQANQHNAQVTPVNKETKTCPFAALQQALSHYFPDKKPCALPFSGGALGAFNYDLGRHIEEFANTAMHDIALADMNIGLYSWALIYDNQQSQWHFVHYHGEQAAKNTLNQLQAWISSTAQDTSFTLASPWQAQISRADYQHKFDKVQQYLLSGDCYQINLTQRFEAQYQGDEWAAYKALRHSNSAPFSAFIRLESQAILSISPERFVQLNGKKVQTKPIKGTRPRFSDERLDAMAANELKQAEKDRAENLMIVDLLRNDIGKVAAPGSVSVPKLFDVESFPAVHHLVSTVTAELGEGIDACELLKACFPGGSITGAPKIRAMQIIEELEPSRRSIYCGSIGYISQDGNMDTSITIRTLVAESGKLYCWAGGGIVADSNADAEYQETYDKVSKILPILAENLLQ
ncbi:aminodeoxychorismate synthase component I [Shewanella waksmanii]|uniref:aminodeoxychorismate synthase component I n=1 Tax=Shewanella waksmanii TaxID=213783 RepID=UPI0037363C32